MSFVLHSKTGKTFYVHEFEKQKLQYVTGVDGLYLLF
jgi:hypothetical protein